MIDIAWFHKIEVPTTVQENLNLITYIMILVLYLGNIFSKELYEYDSVMVYKSSAL